MKICQRISLFLLTFLAVFQLASCNKQEVGEGPYDEITRSLEVNFPYEDTKFKTEGAAIATVTDYRDGDTVEFITKYDETVVIRFYGIDTPESTGQVEKWGKAASIFTKTKLENAESIVLEATATPAENDSFGSRYLGYVWYKEKGDTVYKNLNLELVENGYSANKCLATADYKYYTYFKEAEEFAKKNKIRIWGDDEDPFFSSKAIETDLKKMSENPNDYYNQETETGSKVRVTAYVKQLYTNRGDTYTYQLAQVIDGKEYTIDLYAGYSSNPAINYLKIGSEYVFTGSVQERHGKLQMSGVTYVPLESGGDYLTRTNKEYYLTFDSKLEYDDINSSLYKSSLFKSAKITEAKLEDGKIVALATAYNHYDEEERALKFIIPNNENLTAEEVVALKGKEFTTTGIQHEKGIITVYDFSNFKFI